MADLTMSYEDNLAEADHIIQEQRKRITELESEVERWKQEGVKHSRLSTIEECAGVAEQHGCEHYNCADFVAQKIRKLGERE